MSTGSTSGTGGAMTLMSGRGNAGSLGSPYPGQKNAGASVPGGIIGSIVGAAYGGYGGAVLGNLAGKSAGYQVGNMWAGKDAYNGSQGDFWDNFNPASRYGAGSFIAPYRELNTTLNTLIGKK